MICEGVVGLPVNEEDVAFTGSLFDRSLDDTIQLPYHLVEGTPDLLDYHLVRSWELPPDTPRSLVTHGSGFVEELGITSHVESEPIANGGFSFFQRNFDDFLNI